MRRVALGALELAYQDRGHRPALLLVHGFPFDHAIWGPQIDAFAPHRRVLAPDLIGFGASSPGGRPSLDDHADDLAGLLENTNAGRAVVVGMSMGGYIALALWRRHAERCAGLVLAGTRAGPDTEAGRAGRYQMAISVSAQGVGAVADALLPRLAGPGAPPALAAEMRDIMHRQPRPGVIAALKAMAARPSSAPDLPHITVPTLVVCGTEDAIIPSTESEAIAAAVPSARLVKIPGAGHVPNLEEPGAFNSALRDFLASLDDAGGS